MNQSMHGPGIDESFTSSDQSAINLLEINRYLRTQKDQLEEKYESLKLDHEILLQRFKTSENDLDFHRKQSQMYEAECNQLKASNNQISENTNLIASTSMLDTDSMSIMIDTNKRLKEQVDSLNSENSKLSIDLRQMEEDVLNLRGSLSTAELKCESLMGESDSMRIELKKWKEKVDQIMRNSDMGDEWTRIQNELQSAQEQVADLNSQIEQFKSSSEDQNKKYEQLEKELQELKAQSESEKLKLQQELDALKADKSKREEMLRSIIRDLKEVLTSIAKELGVELPQDRKKPNFKEELATMKNLILEKIKADREEFSTRIKAFEESSGERQTLDKKIEELENRIREKETKIGQLTNFVNVTKNRLTNLQNSNTELQKEIDELKSAAATSTGTGQQQQEINAAQKNEIDTMKNKILQSQMEVERLRKELADSKASASLNQQQQPQQQTTPNNQPNKVVDTQQQLQQQQPPTAYIAPSRIQNKPTGQALQSQTQQNGNIPSSQSSAQGSQLFLRKTVAVQPTPHLAQSTNQADNVQWPQSQQPQESAVVVPSTSQTLTSSSSIAKRAREEESVEEIDQSEDVGSSSSQSNSNKKQRGNNLDENEPIQQQSENFAQDFPQTSEPIENLEDVIKYKNLSDI
jgi:chromosome segregation ATPase